MDLLLIPLFVLIGLVVVFGVFVILGRFRGGRYLAPIVRVLLRVPWLGKGLQKAQRAALEQQNPELASAMRKLERANVGADPQRAQQALSRLSAAERRAYMAAMEDQNAIPEPTNRAQRRQLQKARKRR